jgi:N-acetylmuramoyl-L-alanine amidase
MIDPIGDAKYTGREIEDTFERVLTLQCAQKLKEIIHYNFSHAQVIITRAAGETVTTKQNASFANRMNVDLYLAISFYYQTSIPNNVAIYYYRQNAMDQYHKYDPFHFYHITQAHLINNSLSMNIAKMFLQMFQDTNINSYFLPLGSFGIPCMPLFGVTSPAIYIEAGLKNKNDWHHLITPIIATIKVLIS